MFIQKLQQICSTMIDEEEVHKGIGIYTACEKLAELLFGNNEDKQIWLEGCLSDDALAYMRKNDIPNWVDK